MYVKGMNGGLLNWVGWNFEVIHPPVSCLIEYVSDW